MEKALLELVILTTIIHVVDTLSFAVRLNSVKSGQVALSFSLFNLFVLVSRTANTFQGPLIGSIIGLSIVHGTNPLPQMHTVIFSATLGTLLGILLIPTFLKLFSAATRRVELTGSIPALVVEALHLNNLKRIVQNATTPSKAMFHRLRFREIPKRFLLFNALATGIYTIGVLAASYSALLVGEENRLAAAGSSAMVNGVATILLTLFIDPKSAIITDQALRGKRPYADVKALVVLLIGTKVIGTLLGQVLFLPSAKMIAYFYNR